MCDHCGCGQSQPDSPDDRRRLSVEADLRAAQAETARHNREHLAARGAVAVNLISSPGAGKTTLLEAILPGLAARRPVVVIEGDQQTDHDAQRIAATGTPVFQINTGAGCHLDARQVHQALHRLHIPQGALVIIENVGNLICPAGFDLGQVADMVLLSVTEGEDKPAKYPEAFQGAAAMVLTKTDLLPHLEFRKADCLRHARALNPRLPIFELSARTGAGLAPCVDWLLTLDMRQPLTG